MLSVSSSGVFSSSKLASGLPGTMSSSEDTTAAVELSSCTEVQYMSQETGIFLRNFAISQHDNRRMPTKFLQSGLAQSTVRVCAVSRVAVNVNQFPQAAFRSTETLNYVRIYLGFCTVPRFDSGLLPIGIFPAVWDQPNPQIL